MPYITHKNAIFSHKNEIHKKLNYTVTEFMSVVQHVLDYSQTDQTVCPHRTECFSFNNKRK